MNFKASFSYYVFKVFAVPLLCQLCVLTSLLPEGGCLSLPPLLLTFGLQTPRLIMSSYEPLTFFLDFPWLLQEFTFCCIMFSPILKILYPSLW